MQDPLLFPHLDVAANVAFGPRSGKRLGRKHSRELAHHWLGEVDAAEFADRMPRQLSGGQAQRVALARALAAEPDVMLLDEPMAGLDVAVATAMRQVLRRVLARDGRSALLVTHDLLDVVTLADRVVVIESGLIVESGTSAGILAAPRSRFGARFAGVNLVSGRVDDSATLVTEWGTAWHGTAGGSLAVGSPAVAVFAPAAVAVYRDQPHGSPRNVRRIGRRRTRQPRTRGASAIRATTRRSPRPRGRRHGRVGGGLEAGAGGARVLRREVAGGRALRGAVTGVASRAINRRDHPEIAPARPLGSVCVSNHVSGALARSCSATAISKFDTLRATHTCVTAVTR